ncbi:hypothetical protein JRQ81_011608 [Phrynocephalus forsythii]|uniref:Phospholipase A2 inhibitor and Ly6/PLAUR domain-containing protein-like n=1 Tax=Phrynocephalus forsythii TaxID=171643 RepID=A0A9Q0X6I0_9SAUR|nr:hypothetical protein JRQ81_011608 [Phrynocephalus forsythii]
MQVLMGLILFFTLLPTGVSLSCEICSGETNCTGERKACPEDKNACAINLMEGFRDSNRFWAINKNCTPSFMCNLQSVGVVLDKGKSLKESITCCLENNCIPAFPELPRSATTHNGKVCPTCYSTKRECPKKTVYCTGANIYCLSFIMIQVFRGKVVETTTKGCTSATSCFTLTQFNGTLFPGSTIKNLTCTLAKDLGLKGPSPSSQMFLWTLLLMTLCCGSLASQ